MSECTLLRNRSRKKIPNTLILDLPTPGEPVGPVSPWGPDGPSIPSSPVGPPGPVGPVLPKVGQYKS